MASFSWRRALIVGGIRSGKSELAEDLVADGAPVVYIATARRQSGPGDDEDTQWIDRIEAHRSRRPDTWRTIEIGEDPLALAGLLTTADPEHTILVEDL